MMRLDACVLAGVGLVLGAPLAAQSPIGMVESFGSSSGKALANVGDVDGDGVNDVLVGSPGAGESSGGMARLCSGRDGSVLLAFSGIAGKFLVGAAVAAARDVDGDGLSDLLIGAPGAGAAATAPGTVLVASAQDGTILLEVSGAAPKDHFGAAVGSMPDLNADGVPELLVGAPGADVNGIDSGATYVISGADGHVLITVPGEAAGDAFGTSVSVVGDVDGDGVSDFAGGALNGPMGPKSGFSRLCSGLDGHLLLQLSVMGYGSGPLEMSPAGDFDHDGVPDLLVVDSWWFAMIFSGDDGSMLFAEDNTQYGTSFYVESADILGDLDFDGWDDVAVGSRFSYPEGSGIVVVYSGIDSSELAHLSGPKPSYAIAANFGREVKTVGDVEGDGLPDLAVGSGGGNVWFMSTDSSPVNMFGSGLKVPGAAMPPVLLGIGSLTPGSVLTLRLYLAKPEAPVFIVAGSTTANLLFKGGVIIPSPQIVLAAGATDSTGRLTLEVHWPHEIAAGQEFDCQCWIVDAQGPKGFTASNAVKGVTP